MMLWQVLAWRVCVCDLGFAFLHEHGNTVKHAGGSLDLARTSERFCLDTTEAEKMKILCARYCPCCCLLILPSDSWAWHSVMGHNCRLQPSLWPFDRDRHTSRAKRLIICLTVGSASIVLTNASSHTPWSMKHVA